MLNTMTTLSDRSMSIAVIGSINLDLVAEVDTGPQRVGGARAAGANTGR